MKRINRSKSRSVAKFNVFINKENFGDCVIKLEDISIFLDAGKFKKQINAFDITHILLKRQELTFRVSDGSVISIVEPINDTARFQIKDILIQLSNLWEKYFPCYNFSCESVDTKVEDMFDLLPCENDIGEADKQLAVQKSVRYSKALGLKSPDKGMREDILKKLKHEEHRVLRISEFECEFPESVLCSSVAHLLSTPFFTVFDLTDDKCSKEYIHLCSIGLRTNKALRALILKGCQIESDKLYSLLASFPGSSKLRKLDLTSALCTSAKDQNFQAIFLALHPQVRNQLTDLRLGGLRIDDNTFREIIKKSNAISTKNLQLRRINLDGNQIQKKTLQEFLSMTPNLRVLTLDGCQVDIAEACDALYKSNCTRLEKLGLSSNKFQTSVEVVRDYFASSKFLQLLNLQESVGGAAVDVLKMIFEGLALVKGPVYDQLRLNLHDCRLGPEAGSLIARHLPELSQVTQIILSDNPFERSIFEIIKCLPKCQRLVHIALGSRDKSSATVPDETLDLLAQTLSEPACRLSRLTLAKLGSTEEMSNFLSSIAENGHRLNHLDIRDYALKDDESGCLFKLLQYTTSPIAIQFNISNLKPKTIMRLNCLIKRKWPRARVQVPNRLYVAHDDQVVVVMHKPSAESVENANVPVFPDVQLMRELEKFDDALLTPSKKFVEADHELTRYETKLRHLMPMENAEQLEAAIPKVHQANLVLTECSKFPTMQIDLLEAALDPEKCNHAVDTAVDEMRESLLKSLEASYKETCDYLRDVIHKNYRQSLASVIEMNSDLNENAREDISLMLNQRLKSAIRSAILDMNVRIAEEMLLKVTKDLKEEVKACLEGFPKRKEFMPYQRMEKSESEYANYSETLNDHASPTPEQNPSPGPSDLRNQTTSFSRSVSNQECYSSFNTLAQEQPSTALKRATVYLDKVPVRDDYDHPESTKPPKESAVKNLNTNEETVGEILEHTGLNRPQRVRNHKPRTVIGLDDSKVLRGPVSTEGLYTSLMPSSDAADMENPAIQANKNEAEGKPAAPKKRTPPVPARPAIPGMTPNFTKEILRKREAGLQKTSPPDPQPPRPAENNIIDGNEVYSIAELRKFFDLQQQNRDPTQSSLPAKQGESGCGKSKCDGSISTPIDKRSGRKT